MKKSQDFGTEISNMYYSHITTKKYALLKNHHSSLDFDLRIFYQINCPFLNGTHCIKTLKFGMFDILKILIDVYSNK